jgi:predicted transcriptional regulator
MITEDAVSRIRAFRHAKKLPKATLAQNAGLSPNALRDMDAADWSPRYDTLKKLLEYIQQAAAASEAA